MARKLKTFVTTGGFFELAVAAPSIKAAAELFGVRGNAFSQGFAHETDDTAIIAATMKQPGVVLRRAVGTKGKFSEEAELPKLSVLQDAIKHKRPVERSAKSAAKGRPATPKSKKEDTAASRKAAQLYDLAAKRRQREEERAAEEQVKARERRERAAAKAQEALDDARLRHDERAADIAKQRNVLERKAREEDEHWESEREKLEAALQRARDK